MSSIYGDYAFNSATSIRFGVENLEDHRLANDDPAFALADPGRRVFVALSTNF
jgi:outer membrane receptor for ferrienterochelin and colicin